MKNNLQVTLIALALWLLNVGSYANSPKLLYFSGEFTSYEDASDTTYWKSDGYGYMLGISGNVATLYDITSISLVKCVEYLITDGYIYYDEEPFGSITMEGDEIFVDVGQQYTFKRWNDAQVVINSLPVHDVTSNPVKNFDVFWQTFEEHCILFDLTGVDWKAAYQTYSPMVNENTSDEELFQILSDMIEPLKDGHTGLEIPGTEYSYSPGTEYEPFWLGDVGKMLENIMGYLNPEEISLAAGGHIFFGKTDDQIGYLNIISMEDLIAGSEADNVEVVKHVMDSLVVAWSDCKGIILDIRLNGGGYDVVSNAIAGYFTESNQLGYTKYIRNGGYNEFLDPLPFYIEPAEAGFFDMPVYLLTSNITASASDVFAMVMSGFPQVTLVGEHTYGIFSDRLDKFLPNGWTFSLSNEKYLSADNVNYEQQGINPDVNISMDEDAFNSGSDNVLEYALGEIAKLYSHTAERMSDEVMVRSYPNPFTDKVIIEVGAADPLSQIIVYSLAGEKVAEFSNLKDHVFEWKAAPIQPGTYICYVKTGNRTQTLKIVKK
ncbi:MAG: T9SS type A sorting domain-containing protein [Bacteroidales bacterium]|nr:T9SS type A sorting domain-containing protein [Bacteroidales bacterium]